MALAPIFDYLDYRKYLQDWFAEKNQGNRRFSLRIWADKAGFKARDYLMRVMRNERNLSQEGIAKLSLCFGFSERQSQYFEALVHFNQAKEPLAKEKAWRRMTEFQHQGVAQRLRLDQFDYYSSWHHAALRSLVPVLPQVSDWEYLGQQLDPPLTAKQARESVEMMIRLGLLEDKGGGRFVATQSALTTGDEIASLAVTQFHKTTMDLVKRSLEKHPAPSRDISGVTMSLSNQGFKRIKSEIRAFRKKVMAIAAEDQHEDMVYQLNLHLIPLTRNRGVA